MSANVGSLCIQLDYFILHRSGRSLKCIDAGHEEGQLSFC